ncbi:MAG: glycosyltransferase family 4 protein [Lactobacillaceae bacterium]|jgi:glycosyltransferase involved in cell wall biosynthesis|nr:glycosyltransferase family 4 protein [Lactobacillaceae bacterium]
MKIGIDLKDLQSDSAYRGIGEVAKQVTNYLLPLLVNDKRIDEVTFFMYEDKQEEALGMLDIPKQLTYNIKYYDPATLDLARFQSLKNAFFPLRNQDVEQVDLFLSYSFLGYLPKSKNLYLVWYDLIPLVLHHMYFLWNNTGKISKIIKNSPFLMKLAYKVRKQRVKQELNKAKHLIAISEYTKQDLQRIFPELKIPIDVAFLGVSEKPAKTVNSLNETLPTKPYLLFVGGIDKKREIAPLIDQFNHLKEAGFDIQIVLAGKAFEDVEKIAILNIKNAILMSPYRDDIINIGYISDEYKAKLYSNSLAFVYPTLYEGFGLPVLEAMLAKTLILTYNNSSLPEVGGEYAFYANDASELGDKIIEMYELPNEKRQQVIDESYEYAKQFTWAKTAQKYYEIMMKDFD